MLEKKGISAPTPVEGVMNLALYEKLGYKSYKSVKASENLEIIYMKKIRQMENNCIHKELYVKMQMRKE